MEANSRSKSKPLVMPALSLPSSSESFGSYYVKSRMLGNYCNLKLNDLSQESPKIIQLTKILKQVQDQLLSIVNLSKGWWIRHYW